MISPKKVEITILCRKLEFGILKIEIYKVLGVSRGPGFRLYSRLTKTTAKKPCFSKSGDTASIPHAILGFVRNLLFKFKNEFFNYGILYIVNYSLILTYMKFYYGIEN